jgi:UDP-N-acetylmuramate dehydrogenase
LENIRKAIIGIREAKLPSPDVLGNAGSFFKNPVIPQGWYNTLQAQWPDIPGYPLPEGQLVKVPAGWLIEAAGWKGKELGNAGVHQNQALVLVNKGGATGKEILQLAQAIETDIWQKFKVRLAREVNVL